MKTFIELEDSVLLWAEEKGILSKATPETQCLKMASEASEVCDAVAKNDQDELEDGIGNTLVALIILAHMKGTDVVSCLDKAYKVIANRTGKMQNGTFIKD